MAGRPLPAADAVCCPPAAAGHAAAATPFAAQANDGPPAPNPFAGFWMGGFEGADHFNGSGVPLDMVHDSGHLAPLDEDHRRAAQAGLRCIRESIGWRLCESGGGRIELDRLRLIQASARRHRLQVLWTLMHYGLPDDLSLHDDRLIDRFAHFSGVAIAALRAGQPAASPPLVVTPINEISFLAWAATQPGLFAAPNNMPDDGSPQARERSHRSGYGIKCRLVRAVIAAMAAMRQVDPTVRLLHAEPVVHVVAPRGRPDRQPWADEVCGWQWQAWDMLSGRAEPALGGRPEWLDLLGVNHYHSSQWEVDTDARLDWAGRDPRRRPLGRLLGDAWQRYRRPLAVAETSHVGVGRAAWLHDAAGEVDRARRSGVPVWGLCLYPLVDRPDWSDGHWHRCGLWHVDHAAAARPSPRRAEPHALAALRAWQRVLPAAPLASLRPVLLAFSHKRWDFVAHRGRQLLERLAAGRQGWRVVFVEEPLPMADGR